MTFILKNNLKTLLFCLGCISVLAMAPVYAWPLMMVGYSVLLYVLVRTPYWLRTGLYASIFFFGYFLTGLYWTSSSLFVDFATWWWALPFSFFGLPLLLCLFPFVVFCACGIIKRYRAPVLIAAFILTDLARGNLLTGFPWNMPAHTWVHTDIMMAALPHIGFYGVNCLTIILLCIPAILYPRSKILTILYVSVITALCMVSIQSGGEIKPPDNVIMVQTNIPQDEKWKPHLIERNLDRYIDMSQQAIISNKPVFLIWPETAISQNMLSYPPLRRKFYRFMSDLPKGSLLLTGYLYESDKGYMNGLAILNDQGEVVNLYDKHHLVPFGEYMPFGIDTLTKFTNLQSGDAPSPLATSALWPDILPLICYEIIFPQYAARADKNDLIVNITNDSWFGKTAGPYQHFDHAIFRARENNLPLVRVSGNGISAIITNHGTILAMSGLNRPEIIGHN